MGFRGYVCVPAGVKGVLEAIQVVSGMLKDAPTGFSDLSGVSGALQRCSTFAFNQIIICFN